MEDQEAASHRSKMAAFAAAQVPPFFFFLFITRKPRVE